MITALHEQLDNLGMWVDRQGRVDGSLFCGSLVPEFTGPQTLGDLLVPATPNAAQIQSPYVLCDMCDAHVGTWKAGSLCRVLFVWVF